jgi:L-ascorbate metabolism protein UlaG (beta-lactamase superfamily)
MIRVTWLGHATVVLEIDDVQVMTDPLLGSNVGLLRRRGPRPDPELWRGADAVLLSHLHPDHAELSSLRKLSGTPIMSSTDNVAWLRRSGLPNAVALSEAWTPIVATGEVEVRLVRADHRHRLMPHRPNDAHGHLLRGPSGAVWVAGDTALHPEMSMLAEMAGGPVDLAIVPIGGWGPRLSPGHMNPEQAATAVSRAGARWALPVHWGTLHPPFFALFRTRWLEQPGPQFAEALVSAAPTSRAVVLRPGEAFVVPPIGGNSRTSG